MLKRFMVMSLLCLSVRTYATDELESAIKKSNTAEVCKQLETTQVSEKELLRLIDLAQQVIYQRKSEYETYMVTKLPSIGLEEFMKDFNLFDKSVAVLGFGCFASCFIAVPTLMILSANGYKGVLFKHMPKVIGLFLCASAGIGYIQIRNYVKNGFRNPAKKRYDDSIEIKNLLIKRYNNLSNI